jgi:hypothetical protein
VYLLLTRYESIKVHTSVERLQVLSVIGLCVEFEDVDAELLDILD